ncbi:hypothetical protein [Spiroplasma endosymbiont of Amphibalanus improvisus]|uniref:hypothetical protein n=1 Tax=Spiroplasma endosymbiont of Amphibalanus improvisus TaxID=3066327 RepID=UPI00313BAE97
MLVGKCDGCYKLRDDITVTNSIKICIDCLDNIEEIVKFKNHRKGISGKNPKQNQIMQKNAWNKVIESSMNNATKARLISVNAVDELNNYTFGTAWSPEKGFYDINYQMDPILLKKESVEKALRETGPGLALSVDYTLQKYADICSKDKKSGRSKKR